MRDTKVLVVEDESITAMSLKNKLQNIGYQMPVIVDSGEDAIKAAIEIKPDIILMDIALKGNIDGIQAAKEISAQYQVPIIFITAHHDEDSFHRAKVSVPYAFLAKPYEIRDLTNAIELALYKNTIDLEVSAANHRYQSIMQNASCGIFIHDENGIIQDINKDALVIFGRNKQQLIGKDFRNYLLESEKSYASTMLDKLLIEKKVGPNIGYIQQPDGKVVVVEFSAAYVEDKKGDFMVSILTDMTERNRLRAQSLLSDKLATVGVISAGLIHEINNPLTWILTNLSYIQNKLVEFKISDSVLQNSLVEVIKESIEGAERIKNLVQYLKGFARVDAENITPIDIKKSLESAISMAQPQCKHKTRIELNFSDDIPLLMMSNSKLQQVFLNLIINSAQSMDDDSDNKNLISIFGNI